MTRNKYRVANVGRSTAFYLNLQTHSPPIYHPPPLLLPPIRVLISDTVKLVQTSPDVGRAVKCIPT
jgi:hypothetical protein